MSIPAILFTALFGPHLQSAHAESKLLAGAAAVDITPQKFPVWVSGGFLAQRGTRANGPLHSRALVMDDGKVKLAIVIVDSLMFRRELIDPAKDEAGRITGIPSSNILIAATHTHSAPSVMGALGTPVDEDYAKWLPGKIVESIVLANENLKPAEAGWAAVKDYEHNFCRRWIFRPDRINEDPFGERNVRAMMHPGNLSRNHTGPSGPADIEFSVLSVRGTDGKLISVLGNYAFHYRGAAPVSADVCGRFGATLAELFGKEQVDETFVGMLSQGTSGDSMWMDYSKPRHDSGFEQYNRELAQVALDALKEVKYQRDITLAMAEAKLKLRRRVPGAKRLAQAKQVAEQIKDRLPRSRPEVYALEAIYLHNEPEVELKLQAIRIGDMGITTLPNEVYGITGLKLKKQSPLAHTFNIELANGGQGYIPPPEQHHLGGYTTWPARTAGLDEQAEPKIVETLISLLEKVSGKKRIYRNVPDDDYINSVRDSKPDALWQLDEIAGTVATDSSGNEKSGKYEMGVAFYLPGRHSQELKHWEQTPNRAAHFAGGRVIIDVSPGKDYSLEFWVWNGMPVAERSTTGGLFEFGEAGKTGDGLLITGTDSIPGVLALKNSGLGNGTAMLTMQAWNHVAFVRQGDHVSVFLNGNQEIDGESKSASVPQKLFIGGSSNNTFNFEGKLDDIAFYQRALSPEEISRHYKASGLTPPKQPAIPQTAAFHPERPEMPEDLKRYSDAVKKSDPIAFWSLHELMDGQTPDTTGKSPALTLEKDSSVREPGGRTPNFNGGRMRTAMERLDNDYSAEMWFWNEMPHHAQPVTGYFFSRGPEGDKNAPGEHLGIGGTHLAMGKLIVFNGNIRNEVLEGTTYLPLRSWNHVVLTRKGKRVRVFLNGNIEPEIDADLTPTIDKNKNIFIGGRNDRFAPFKGRLDMVALYERALAAEEAAEHFKAMNVTASKQPANSGQTANAPPGLESNPLSPEDSLKSIHVREGYRVELVVAEPLVQDPVAIAWGADGKLWIAEMADYPLGVDGKGKPGGRIRFLTDSNGDGNYDRSSLFMEDVRFPTGVLAWRKGVIVTAAPDILYAEDTDNDGRADIQEILFTGFNEGNQQLRINGLRWGIDNWIYCASGGHHARYGADRNIKVIGTGKTIALGSRDFRIRPDEHLLEPESGPSQFGRNCDDWGNWFGVQNSYPLWHYVLSDHYIRRNPHYAPPDPKRQLRLPGNPKVFPAKTPQKRFHSFSNSGHYTSACSAMIYRDELLFPGDETQHAFTCEPFHNLVQHHVVKPDGVSFQAERADDGEIDFFASKDRWCRPVMVRTGPDGALWIVDMYRYMIEHPEFLPAEGKKELEPFYRAGNGRGRIYRILPNASEPRQTPPLTTLNAEQLVEALSTRSGTRRDLVHQQLLWRKDPSTFGPLERLVTAAPLPQTRLAALGVLDGLGQLKSEILKTAFGDPHPGIRRHAIRLAESRGFKEIQSAVSALVNDTDPKVRFQLACSLGEWRHPDAFVLLGKLASTKVDDPYMRAAILGSLNQENISGVLATVITNQSVPEMLSSLIQQAVAFKNHAAMNAALSTLAGKGDERYSLSQLRAASSFFAELRRQKISLKDLSEAAEDRTEDSFQRVSTLFEFARLQAEDSKSEQELRRAAISLLGFEPSKQEEDLNRLVRFLNPQVPVFVQDASLENVSMQESNSIATLLIRNWKGHTPVLRAKILKLLTSRSAWIDELVRACESGLIKTTELGATVRQQLIQTGDKKQQARAEKLFGPQAQANKADPIFQAALKLKPNIAAGAEPFTKLCAQCHKFKNIGNQVGPDLASLTDRRAETLLAAILDPNQSVEPTYLNYMLQTKAERTLSGILVSETATSITLLGPEAKQETVLRSDIVSLQTTGQSLMPEDIQQGLTPQQMADLIAWLSSDSAEK